MSRDVAASIRQRLLNEARRQGRPFQELLQYFAMERFLYRIGRHTLADRFVLKGALLLTALQAAQFRPTIDIDLAARTGNDHEHIRQWIEELCSLAVEGDGVRFELEALEIVRIRDDAEYGCYYTSGVADCLSMHSAVAAAVDLGLSERDRGGRKA